MKILYELRSARQWTALGAAAVLTLLHCADIRYFTETWLFSSVCSADLLCRMSEPAAESAVLLFVFALAFRFSCAQEKAAASVLAYGSRRRLFFSQLGRLTVLAAVWTAWQTGWTMLFSFSQELPLINWDKKYSLYFFRMNETSQAPFRWALERGVWAFFWQVMVTGLMILLLERFVRKSWASLLVWCVFYLADCALPYPVSLFFQRFSCGTFALQYRTVFTIWFFVVPVCVAVLLAGAAYSAYKRRDFV